MIEQYTRIKHQPDRAKAPVLFAPFAAKEKGTVLALQFCDVRGAVGKVRPKRFSNGTISRGTKNNSSVRF
jgi:hypothetical protein